MTAYYNEHDPYAAEWLRALILNGHIAPGDVDESDIRDIRPDELRGYTQCHFFAGIGVWSHALRRAGWPDSRPIWTGSCPCQPFSAAGAGAGFADERHLWPAFNHLIDQCQPATVVGEQVENAGAWLDLVSSDLEAQGYAFGAAFLPAAGFGGAHIRSRCYWMVDSQQPGLERLAGHGDNGDKPGRVGSIAAGPVAAPSGSGGMADAQRHDGRADKPGRGPEGRGFDGGHNSGLAGSPATNAPMLGRNPVDWLFCRDGKWRPIEPGTFPLADAAPARVGRLRAYGNALDAETATQFCCAVMECVA